VVVAAAAADWVEDVDLKYKNAGSSNIHGKMLCLTLEVCCGIDGVIADR
jgi:hypothetical protein